MFCPRNGEHSSIVLYSFPVLLVGLFLLLRCIPLVGEVNEQTLDLAESLEANAHAASEEENYEEAATLFKQAAEVFAAQGDTIRHARCLVEQGKAQIELNHYDEALVNLEAAGKIYHETPDVQPLDKAVFLWQKGRAVANSGKDEEGLKILQAARDIFEGLKGADRETAGCLRTMSNVLYALDRYEEALSIAESAWIAFEGLPNTEKDRAECLKRMGWCLQSLKRYPEAVEKLEVALNLYAKLPGTEWSQAHTLYNIGNIMKWTQDKNDETDARYQQALSLLESIESSHLGDANYFRFCAEILQITEQYEKAIIKYKQAEKIYGDADEHLSERVDIAGDIARCLESLGINEETIVAYQHALKLANTNADQFTKEKAMFFLSLSNLYMQVFRFQEALDAALEVRTLASMLPESEQQEYKSMADMLETVCLVASGEGTYDTEKLELLESTFSQTPDQGEILFNILNTNCAAYMSLFQYQNALEKMGKALVLAETLEDANLKRAEVLSNIAEIKHRLREYSESLKSSKEAQELFEGQPDTEAARISCLLKQTEVLTDICQYDEALLLNDQATHIAEAIPNTDVLLADCAFSKARVLFGMYLYPESIIKYREALDLYQKSPESVMQQLHCLSEIVAAQQRQGLYKATNETLREMQQQVLICQEEAARILPLSAKAYQVGYLLSLGEMQFLIGQLSEGLKDINEALQVAEKIPHGELVEAGVRLNLAASLVSVGDYNKALSEVQQAESTFQEISGSEYDTSCCLRVRADCLIELARYPEAYICFERAGELLSQNPAWRIDYAKNYLSKAEVLNLMGRNEEALVQGRTGADFFRSYPTMNRDFLNGMLQVTSTLISQRDHSKALLELDNLEETMALLPNPEILLLSCWEQRAICLFYLRRHEEALAVLDKAIVTLKARPEIHPYFLNIEQQRRYNFSALQRYEEAIETSEIIMRIQSQYPRSSKEETSWQINAAFSLVRLGRTVEAQQELHDAHRALYDLFVPNFPMMIEQQKTEFVLKRFPEPDPVYTLAFSDGNLSVEGLDTALMHKGLIEYALQQEQRILQEKSRDNPEVKSLYETLLELRRRYAALSHSNDSPLSQFLPSAESVNPILRKQMLDDFKEQIDATETKLAEISISFAEEMKLRRVSTTEVYEALKILAPKGALLEYVKYAPEPFDDIVDFTTPKEYRGARAAHYGLFILRADSPVPIAVDLGPAAPIDEAVNTFRAACQNYIEKQKKKKVTYLDTALARTLAVECAEAGEKLRSLIFDPALLHLSECKRLFIAPDDALFLLPFEAFPTPDCKDKALRYLVEDYEIIYLNAGRDLAHMTLQSRDTSSVRPSVIVAGPNMEMPMTTYLAQVSALQSEQSSKKENAPDVEDKPTAKEPSEIVQLVQGAPTNMEDAFATSLQTMGGGMMETLQDLLFSRESQFKENQFKEFVQAATNNLSDAQVYTWEEAIEERVKVSSSPRLLQILTHGLFLPMDQIMGQESFQNPLLRSLLVLAGATTIAREKAHTDDTSASAVLDDGLLTAYEVTGMNLQGTELVALTACQTALFDTMPGQSMAGLRRAFSLAGAQSMIMAQWEVPVGPSAMQMEYFYDAWLGKQNAIERYTAFHEAQLEALRFARKEDFKGHPWIWAGFVYIGDPGTTQQPSFGKSDQ